jgi:hypothetical protein
MVIVDFNQLKKEMKTAREYFQSKLDKTVEVWGNKLVLPDIKLQDAKLLAESFLRDRGIGKNFQVADLEGDLEIVRTDA